MLRPVILRSTTSTAAISMMRCPSAGSSPVVSVSRMRWRTAGKLGASGLGRGSRMEPTRGGYSRANPGAACNPLILRPGSAIPAVSAPVALDGSLDFFDRAFDLVVGQIALRALTVG